MQVYCDKHDLDAIFYSADSFTDDSSNPLPRNRYCRPDLLTNKIMTGVDFFIKSVHSNSYWPSACLYLVRREIAEEIKFVPNIYHEDNLYTTQLLSHPHLVRLMAVNSPLYLRRLHASSITGTAKNLKHAEGYLQVYNELLKVIDTT